ncbi:IPP transferase-domain-containing protein [Phlebopus sp. FC_14]|nr:IPP transferase-domain-containing protein [Phlebopus sp. FC_14]
MVIPTRPALKMTSLQPLIAICGTTGVGKSKLGIELALSLKHEIHKSEEAQHGQLKWRGARIINADSMQVYAGMDVITNKVPHAERMDVEHLLMDFKQPGEQYVVGQWVQDAIQAIEDTHNRNEIPIVVGGTLYWIQHLVFPNRLSTEDSIPSSQRARTTKDPMSPSLDQSISRLPSNLLDLLNALPEHPPNAATHPDDALSLYNLLRALDEPVASRWHWRDTRKVLRSLHIMKETGRTPSDIINEQSKSVLIPRYRTLCFWLYAEPSKLNSRLDARVDDMIEQGLLDEIRMLQTIATSQATTGTTVTTSIKEDSDGPAIDYTLGIYQCIGYKEFRHFLSSPEASQEAFESAVEDMKLSTRKYAKRQVTWLRNKLLPAVNSVRTECGGRPRTASMYLLDATALGNAWRVNVLEPAQSIMHAFLLNKELPDPSSLSVVAQTILAHGNNKPVKYAFFCYSTASAFELPQPVGGATSKAQNCVPHLHHKPFSTCYDRGRSGMDCSSWNSDTQTTCCKGHEDCRGAPSKTP